MNSLLKSTILLFFALPSFAQSRENKETFTHRDSLQGGLRFERACFDVQHYDLNFTVDINNKYLSGYNKIRFKIVENTTKIQLDLFDTMKVDSIVFRNKKLTYKRDENAVFINFDQELIKGNVEELRFFYSGNPIIAKRAPWDGGFVFKKDSNDKDWVGVAVQGVGASLWFPVKDSQTDEPDLGASIKVAVPNGLTGISNGRFKGSHDLNNGYTLWDWEVTNPINSYDITVYIGDFVHWHDNHNGIDLDYYVLRENETKARKQFEEVKPMLDCFEGKFGTYPFKEDGYKLVDAPYLGMEHQSAVAYGNEYKMGYLGSDISGTGFGMLFDFIIIHESGHEWFGNSITSSDIADMWIHEGFTCYSEAVYLECHYGYEKAEIYLNGLKKNIQNDKPIIASYGVNKEGSSDMYYKGALLLHTIRNYINDDTKWWELIKKYAETFRHQIITTEIVIEFFNKETHLNLTPIFYQYLRHIDIPTLQFKKENKKYYFRWKASEKNFTLPVDILYQSNVIRIIPTSEWESLDIKIKKLDEIEVLTNKIYIQVD